VIDSTGYKYTSLCRICEKLASDSSWNRFWRFPDQNN
jgi:hypothetical protein